MARTYKVRPCSETDTLVQMPRLIVHNRTGGFRMNRSSIAFATALAIVGATGMMLAQGQSDNPHGVPPNAAVHWARGEAPAARPNRSPNLVYHGGPVMHGTFVEPIFWG